MKAVTNIPESDRPAYLDGWKSEAETLSELRKLKPTLHKTTLGRMRRRNEITATKFAGCWFYKPESAFEKVQFVRLAN